MRNTTTIRAMIGLTALAFAGAALADKTTINGVTFDFDAPAPALSQAQNAFASSYRNAVNHRDRAALMALEHPSISSCTYLNERMRFADFRHTIPASGPASVKVRFFASSHDLVKAMDMEKLVYLPVRPTAILGISVETREQNMIKSFTILRPVRQEGQTIRIVPYCLTPEGHAKVG